VPALRDAFTRGRTDAGTVSQDPEHPGASFENGAAWVRDIVVPAIERGNTQLEPENIAFRYDLNLDPRSTNHAHADVWLMHR
jgi:hypothetical protein